MRLILIFLALLGVIGTSTYFYWINSPLFAFQEGALALKDHDGEKFKKYVAADEIIDHFIDDLVVDPALSTPNLSQFQSSVASGALAMAKISMSRTLLQSINDYFSPGQRPPQNSYLQFFGIAPARAQTSQVSHNAYGIKDLLHAAGDEMSAEVTKLKTVAYRRMVTFIQNHPQSVPGRILDCPPQERPNHIRAMLQEYGLSLDNFKGLAGYATSSDIAGRETAQVGFTFFSPRINHTFALQVEVKKDLATGTWRIDRLLNIKAVMDEEEPFYDRDIHELVEYSLSGMSDKNMAQDMKGMTERLKQSSAAQNILKRLNLNLR